MDSDPEDDDLLDIPPELLKAVTWELLGYDAVDDVAENVARRIINIVFGHMNPERT